MSEHTTGDEYSRGRAEEKRQHRQPKVNPRFRPVIVVVWGVGLVILFVLSLFSQAGATIPWVLLVTHLALAWLVRLDIKSIRKQGVDWGVSRHLWFGATVLLPLAAPAYYLYSGRVVDRENERRKRTQGLDDDGEDDADGTDDPGADAAGASR